MAAFVELLTMRRHLFAYCQYVTPQRCLTAFAGWLANCRIKSVKNFLIKRFIKTYQIDMAEAKEQDINAYPTFNDFFIRELKPGTRPITPGEQDIASPADGTIAEMGLIKHDQLFQAKDFYYTLDTLLGSPENARDFYDGSFTTVYLAPYNYHRFHMPITGKLTKTTYVPGKLFSVNRTTSEFIPNLYARNERLIAFFDTEAGPMAIVMVGAMIVGSICIKGMDRPIRCNKVTLTDYPNQPILQKGEELGYFELGSTVIVIFGQDKAQWAPSLLPGDSIQVGQFLGNFSKINA